ncbi:NAD(P)/FAD-dependent oxidoreductase [Azonexus sp.]|jgi:sulfite dehydrogenase|uniref:NAD(P)/FAD-dependent oxidoreductase n=1 Tax=Azonexus sp. TaxID=1872668 RepID=UPI00281B690A|nr:NAD(P)/FAD-dependent oxidoreductase [Azonexus sp.]MDR1994875.1 NAD(P)/FAD-dependent oxidoreductase [Azonexus sp.]
MANTRRDFLRVGAATGLLAALAGCASGGGSKANGHVVVVGGGYGGATAAKYLRLWSEGGVQVTLIERKPTLVSCPVSNRVIGGQKTLADITLGYAQLQSHWGVQLLQDEAVAVDTAARTVRLATGGVVRYDRLVLSPGIDFLFDRLPGLAAPAVQDKILHAWQAGPQTVALRRQLEAMRDGGTYIIAIPRAPYRCPPAPYERACLAANYFKQAKPRSKVVILDANDDVQAKKDLFTKAWSELYPGIIEYRANSEVRDVHAASNTAVLASGRLKADVLNVIPQQRAGQIARQAGLKLVNQRWVDVDWLTMESSSAPGVHVLGDAVFPAPTMIKSGHMANQQAKLAAAAILNLLAGQPPNPEPVLINACYSFVDDRQAIHVTSVYRYNPATKVIQPVKGAGGVSAAHSEEEGRIAEAWAKNIWADMLT